VNPKGRLIHSTAWPKRKKAPHGHGQQPEQAEAPEVFFVQKPLGNVDHKAAGYQHDSVDQGFANFQPLKPGGVPVCGSGFVDDVAHKKAEENDAFRQQEDNEAKHAVVFFFVGGPMGHLGVEGRVKIN
jgi:hypothetical protein